MRHLTLALVRLCVYSLNIARYLEERERLPIYLSVISLADHVKVFSVVVVGILAESPPRKHIGRDIFAVVLFLLPTNVLNLN